MNIRYKYLKLDQSKRTRAKQRLGTKIEQETVDKALDALLVEERVLRALRKARATGSLVDVFAKG